MLDKKSLICPAAWYLNWHRGEGDYGKWTHYWSDYNDDVPSSFFAKFYPQYKNRSLQLDLFDV